SNGAGKRLLVGGGRQGDRSQNDQSDMLHKRSPGRLFDFFGNGDSVADCPEASISPRPARLLNLTGPLRVYRRGRAKPAKSRRRRCDFHCSNRVGKVGKWGLPSREGNAAYERASSVTTRQCAGGAGRD